MQTLRTIGAAFADDIRATARFVRDAADSGATTTMQDDLADQYEVWGPHVMETLDFQPLPGMNRALLGLNFGPRMALDGIAHLRAADEHIVDAMSLKTPVDGAAWTAHMRAAADELAPFLS